MVISEAGYSLPRYLGGTAEEPGQGCPGYIRTQLRRVADQSYSASSQQGQSNSQGVLGLEEGDCSRLDASGALLREYSSSRLQGSSDMKLISLVSTIATETFGEMRVLSSTTERSCFLDIAITGSTWLRLDREQRRRGVDCSLVRLFCSRHVECLVPLPRARAKAKMLNRSNC